VSETPHAALRRLEPLIGTWEITGRTLDASADNIRGRVVIEWLLGGRFQQQRGEIEMPDLGLTVHSLEIIGYDQTTDSFPAQVYSNLGEGPAAYAWDVRGNIVRHWTKGSKYTGTLSEDGNTLTGGWRPDSGPGEPGGAYDATMRRVR
jgi:hypothetical protein